MSYIPLHLHTTFSALDSCIKIPDLVTRLKELEIPACAITDHGNLYGTIDFYGECKKNSIKPILGMEAYATEDPDNTENKNKDNYHIILLAKNETGWKNLIRLSSNAFINNFYYRPRINRTLFEQYGSGLICLSACLAGYPASMLRWEREEHKMFMSSYKEYVKVLKWFSEVFNGDFYLEIQNHSIWEQVEFNNLIIPIARKEKIPLVITSDAHFLKKEDKGTHELLIAMQLKKTLEEYRQEGKMIYPETNYLLSSPEMKEVALLYDAPDSYENTQKIAEQINLEIKFGEPKLPTFDIKAAEDYSEFLEWKEIQNDKTC